jgi:hypothetical protein
MRKVRKESICLKRRSMAYLRDPVGLEASTSATAARSVAAPANKENGRSRSDRQEVTRTGAAFVLPAPGTYPWVGPGNAHADTENRKDTEGSTRRSRGQEQCFCRASPPSCVGSKPGDGQRAANQMTLLTSWSPCPFHRP